MWHWATVLAKAAYAQRNAHLKRYSDFTEILRVAVPGPQEPMETDTNGSLREEGKSFQWEKNTLRA